MKGGKKFEWTEKCELAFQQLEKHLGKPPLLTKLVSGDRLFLYLAVLKNAANSVLVQEENKVQHPVYYVSKRLLDAELRYPDMEKLAYALVISSRKLWPYFQAHTLEVLTSSLQELSSVAAKDAISHR